MTRSVDACCCWRQRWSPSDPLRRGGMPNFIELLQRKLSRIGDAVLQKMIATSLIGGLSGLFTAYLQRADWAQLAKQFIDYCINMLLITAAPYVPAASSASRSNAVSFAPRDRHRLDRAARTDTERHLARRRGT